MADDNTLRSYRSNDNYRRSANPAEAQEPAFGGSDPLAELARLIGQSDPFTDNSARRDTGRREPPAAARPQREYDDNDWRRHVQRPSYDMPDEPMLDASRYKTADPHDSYADHDPYRVAAPRQEHYADARQEHYADAHGEHFQTGHSYAGHAHADYRHDPSYAPATDYPDEPIYAVPPQRGDYAGGEPPQGEEAYDDPPRRKRGSSLVTAVILIGCAMLGTAGAYGYRTYSSMSPGAKQAPVIIADSAPSKVVPSADQRSGRSQDRVGQGNDERLVSREEQPVALPGTSGVPRVVFPAPIQQTPPTTTGSTPSASAAQADQPKRIRTVTIRPEGGDASGQPSINEMPARAAPPPAARTAPPRTPSRDQPLLLDPNAPAPVNEPQQRTQTPPAPREPAAPASGPRLAAAPASGGFVVQVSSQKSEADAQASYRALQAKYAMLKSHQPIIRRADLGSKGVFYRAMVGPFESGDEAVQFCNGLKQAGGQCIIHRN